MGMTRCAATPAPVPCGTARPPRIPPARSPAMASRSFPTGRGQGHERSYGQRLPLRRRRPQHPRPPQPPHLRKHPRRPKRPWRPRLRREHPHPPPPRAPSPARVRALRGRRRNCLPRTRSALANVRIEVVQEGRGHFRTATTNGDGVACTTSTACPPELTRVHEIQPPWLRFSSTPNGVIVFVAAGDTLTIDFGDWNGRRTGCR